MKALNAADPEPIEVGHPNTMAVASSSSSQWCARSPTGMSLTAVPSTEAAPLAMAWASAAVRPRSAGFPLAPTVEDDRYYHWPPSNLFLNHCHVLLKCLRLL
jgi:hypothetical protein